MSFIGIYISCYKPYTFELSEMKSLSLVEFG